MTSKIKSVTIVNQQSTNSYHVGSTYNGLLLDRIIDNSIDTETSFTSIHTGKTLANEIVFEAINAPIDVQYTV